MTNDVRQVVEQLRELTACNCSHKRRPNTHSDGCNVYAANPVLIEAADLLENISAQCSEVAELRAFRDGWRAERALIHAELDKAGVPNCDDIPLRIEELACRALTAQPAPSGWQQRIAAMDPWIPGEKPLLYCAFCERWKMKGNKGRHAPDCLWQNAVDAGQPAKDALPPAPPADFQAFLKSLESGLTALQAFMGEGRHAHTCNGDEDGPCDCGYVDPEDVVEAMLMDVRSRKGALPPAPEASPAKLEKHADTCAGHDGLRYCDCGVDQRKFPSSYARGGPEPDYIKAEADASPTQDPITAAVHAELEPLADALIEAGHKLAKDGGA